ncbi:DNA mismatch repair protein MSH3 [Nakaseomyces bracarensis]|uniref:DNA mismatch repair protein MSH3 n=1 Tax=Nakaseomyces bracarensis TaxID=273131 RepID=A0ABR4NSZ7_9SACH
MKQLTISKFFKKAGGFEARGESRTEVMDLTFDSSDEEPAEKANGPVTVDMVEGKSDIEDCGVVEELDVIEDEEIGEDDHHVPDNVGDVKVTEGGLDSNGESTLQIKAKLDTNGAVVRLHTSEFNAKLDRIMGKRKLGKIRGSLIEEDGVEESESEEKETGPQVKKRKGNSSTLTPLDRQVKELKLQNMDKILVVRVGYKYKIFAQDAVKVSPILHLHLIPGKVTIDDSNPRDANYRQFAYCSFPDVRLNVHLERMVRNNLKVAVIEQQETAATKKFDTNKSKSTVFERKITGIYSKATYAVNCGFEVKDGNILGSNNTIWALNVEQLLDHSLKYTLFSVQLSSGEVIFDTFEDKKGSCQEIDTHIKYLKPSEIVIDDMIELPPDLTSRFSDMLIYRISRDSYIKTEIPDGIPYTFKEKELDMFKLVVNYCSGYSNEKIFEIGSNYRHFSSNTSMEINAQTIANLDVISNEADKGTLFWIVDHTRTAFGSRKMKEWILRPLQDKSKIEDRQACIACMSDVVDSIFFESFNQLLKGTPDLLRTINRITFGKTSQREIYQFLKQMTLLISHFKTHRTYIEDNILSEEGLINKQSTLLSDIISRLFKYANDSTIPELLLMINVSAIMEKDQKKQLLGFFNLNNYDNSENIIRIQRDIDEVKDRLNEELQEIRKLLKRPHLCYKDEIDFLIEVRNTQVKGIPKDWVKVNNTKMISRFLTPKTKELVELLQYHKDLLLDEITEEYKLFLKRIASDYHAIKNFVDDIAIYDCMLSLTAVSCNVGYTKPKFIESSEQRLVGKKARNPVIESLDVDYVPNDINMHSQEGRVVVITGPNMGGKSSYIRQVALLVILAQMGSFVPAESLELTVFDNILTRIGSNDDILKGQSTFKTELNETVQILNTCTKKSLLLLDEVGRGTGTRDGNAIAWALLNYFVNKSDCPFILFTTHFTIVTTIENKLLRNYHMDYVEQKNEQENWTTVIFLYVLKPGVTESSYGLNVAKLAGIDRSIINRAHEVAEQYKLNTEFDSNLVVLYKLKEAIKGERTSEDKLKLLMDI